IVVDTGSSDDTADVAAAAHPAGEVIRNTEDFGLAAANNQGFDQAETEYVLHVNPDARVDPGCLEQLIETADANPNAAGVAPLLINGRGDMELDVMGARERHHHKLPEAPDGPFCTWFITGAVVLWRLSAVRSIDGFDAGFFMYNEDTDICLRSTRGGYSLILDPGVSAHHYGGASGGTSLKSRIRKDWMMAWGHLY
ncbi:MAG: glycosyltransferase, partial [Magnetovibrio sp.]|nr:glycosyltransferase [Magnetovibrio sp.]